MELGLSLYGLVTSGVVWEEKGLRGERMEWKKRQY